jgi:hypothetical protein
VAKHSAVQSKAQYAVYSRPHPHPTLPSHNQFPSLEGRGQGRVKLWPSTQPCSPTHSGRSVLDPKPLKGEGRASTSYGPFPSAEGRVPCAMTAHPLARPAS